MTNKVALSKEQLIAALAIRIAEEHYETNEYIYGEEAEFYVDEGITKGMYMAGSGESIRPMIKEETSTLIGDLVCRHYEKLVRAKFPRIKKSDFVW